MGEGQREIYSHQTKHIFLILVNWKEKITQGVCWVRCSPSLLLDIFYLITFVNTHS